MKNAALQFTRQHLQEAKQYQESDMNVAEYLILNAQSAENGYLEYLTDEEIEDFENSLKRREELEKEVEGFINDNFDFNFEEFEY
jgi:hypothetical protein